MLPVAFSPFPSNTHRRGPSIRRHSQFHVNLLSYDKKLHTMKMKNRSSAYEKRAEETIEVLFMRNSRRKFLSWKLKALAFWYEGKIRKTQGNQREIELRLTIREKIELYWKLHWKLYWRLWKMRGGNEVIFEPNWNTEELDNVAAKREKNWLWNCKWIECQAKSGIEIVSF